VGVGQLQCDRKAGQAAADDGDVEIHDAEMRRGALGRWGKRESLHLPAMPCISAAGAVAAYRTSTAWTKQKAPRHGGAFWREPGSIT